MYWRVFVMGTNNDKTNARYVFVMTVKRKRLLPIGANSFLLESRSFPERGSSTCKTRR